MIKTLRDLRHNDQWSVVVSAGRRGDTRVSPWGSFLSNQANTRAGARNTIIPKNNIFKRALRTLPDFELIDFNELFAEFNAVFI